MTQISVAVQSQLNSSDNMPAVIAGACAGLRSASRSVTQLYDLVLAPTGLKATQFIMLKAIYEAGEIAQCDFARRHAVAVETLSRRFAGLRKKGFVELRIGKNHSERIYALTDDGRRVLERALPYWDLAQRRLRHALGEEDWINLERFSQRICRAAREAEHLRMNNQVDSGGKRQAPDNRAARGLG
jgi:DNA-binding MarR family transcriptional regulator